MIKLCIIHVLKNVLMKNMKTMVMKEDEREKQQSWQNQEYVQSATNRILIIHSSKQMNVKERRKNRMLIF